MKAKTTSKKTNKKKWRSAQDLGFYDPYAAIKQGKVRITTFIDSDVLIYFKKHRGSVYMRK